MENEITILDCNTLSLGDDSVSANMFTSLLPSSSDNEMNYLGCYNCYNKFVHTLTHAIQQQATICLWQIGIIMSSELVATRKENTSTKSVHYFLTLF